MGNGEKNPISTVLVCNLEFESTYQYKQIKVKKNDRLVWRDSTQ